MVAPLIPTLARLLLASRARSVQSLITSLYNKSGKTLSQRKLWELTRSDEGIKELTKIYNKSEDMLTISKVKKQIANEKTGELTKDDLKNVDMNSPKVRSYLAKKVLKRISSEEIQVKQFLLTLASNILSGVYSIESNTLEEIEEYLDTPTVAEMIENVKVYHVCYDPT